MSELEKRLSKKQFFRCHNSYMVNFDYVEGVKKDSVLIKDKVQKLKTIPISKYKKETVCISKNTRTDCDIVRKQCENDCIGGGAFLNTTK